MMAHGPLVTLWTIRLSCGLYTLGCAGWLTNKRKTSRLAWTAAYLFYLIHVWAAFAFYHHWSHEAAYLETARQTAELFGIHWGGGIYFNYVFTVVWGADVWRRWSGVDRRPKWPRWIDVAIQSFLAFMFLNATVVFGSGWVRWSGVIAAAGLGLLWWRYRLRNHG
jgi:hypothetical protein